MRKEILISVLLLISACGFNRPEDKYFKEAAKFKSEGDLGKAADGFRKVIATSPRSDRAKEALYQLGEVYYQTGDAKKSIKVFKAYLDLASPRGKRKFIILSRVATLYYQKMGDPQQALGYYLKALEYSPSREDKFDVFLSMGNCYFKMYKFDTAVEFFNKAVIEAESVKTEAIIPKLQEALYYMAFSYSILTKDINESALSKHQEQINTVDPIKKTIEILDKCINCSDKSKYGILCKFEKAENLLELDEKDKALAMFMELRDLYPNKAVIETKIKKIEEGK
jgi:tetratricopeptide (TPR) repeat protein